MGECGVGRCPLATPKSPLAERLILAPLQALLRKSYIVQMETLAPLRSWWQPLPLWLKLITVLIAFPAWLFIVYCVLEGQAKSPAAFFAFAAFTLCAILHITFDSRNRRSGRESSGGLELDEGE